MISGEWQKVIQKAARWPCGVCGRGVGNNSIQCFQRVPKGHSGWGSPPVRWSEGVPNGVRLLLYSPGKYAQT